MTPTERTAIVAGGTGLVGRFLLEILINQDRYRKIISVTRGKLSMEDPKLDQVTTDFNHLEKIQDNLVGTDVFCCLGTTIKKAGSKEAFRRVDFDYPLSLASICCENGAERFLLVSAMGADSDSVFFYNRVKGDIEAAVCKLDFNAIHIFRPSLLLGPRPESRPGEEWGKMFARVIPWLGPLRKYQPIQAREVAAAMFQATKSEAAGVHIYPSDKIRDLG